MKHFVYLTEDKLYYIRRAPGRSGGYYFLGFRPVAGLEGVESAMESLSEVYNLKGRKVTVIMGVKVGIHVVNLPASTKSTALQMAGKTASDPGRRRGTASGSRFLSFFSGRNAAGRGLYSAGKLAVGSKISCFTGQAAFKRNPSVTCLCGILSRSQRVWYGRKSHGAGPSVRRLYRPV